MYKKYNSTVFIDDPQSNEFKIELDFDDLDEADKHSFFGKNAGPRQLCGCELPTPPGVVTDEEKIIAIAAAAFLVCMSIVVLIYCIAIRSTFIF